MLQSQQKEPDLPRTKHLRFQVFVGVDHFVLLINKTKGLFEQRYMDREGTGSAQYENQHWFS